MHFAWGDCGGNVDNNGAGEPKVQSGWVEVTAVDYATQTVSYRFFLDVCSDIDGHNMQNIMGTFQVHEDLVGYLKLNKQSILPDISNNNPCYSLAGAKYGIYATKLVPILNKCSLPMHKMRTIESAPRRHLLCKGAFNSGGFCTRF